jgi:hypothetical protein
MKGFVEAVRVRLIRMLGGTPHPREVRIFDCEVHGELKIEEGVCATIVGCVFTGPITEIRAETRKAD